MTQATDLGQIANIPGAGYRARVNAGFQALASLHYGTSAPSPTYPLMAWADQSTGTIWLRDATNTAWSAIGEIGPPFAWTAMGETGSGFVTGDVKVTLRAVADPGWVLMDDGSIGAATSGATSRANADCEDLFALLWTNIADAHAPLQDASGTPVGRGASATADWLANRRLVLPKTLGRALASAGWGSGLSERALGEAAGAETHQLTVDELPLHGHPYRAALTNQETASSNTSGGFLHSLAGNSTRGPYTGTPTASIGIGGSGGDQPHPIVQPTTFVHFMVKL